MYAFPIFKLPEPTGEFKVGTQTFHFVDTKKEEIFDEARDGNRELMVQVGYPAQVGTGTYAPFIPDTQILRYMAASYSLPGFTFQHLKYISRHAYSGTEGNGNEHLNFTDIQFIFPIFIMMGITGKVAPERANSVINTYMLDFFDMCLKNQGGILRMKGTDPRFPEVKFVTSLL